MEEMKTFIKARGRLKTTITRIYGYAENPAPDADVFAIDTKLETLSNAWNEFVKSGDELAKYDKLEGYVDPTEDFGIYEEKYEIANARLKALRAALAPSGKLEEIGAAGNDGSLFQGILQQMQNQQQQLQLQMQNQQQQLQLQMQSQMEHQQRQMELQMQSQMEHQRRQMEQQQLLVERLLSPQQSSSSSGSQSVATAATRDCELPKINIKPFGGDYKEWHAFKDLFESTIHGKTTLTNIQKFHHLKSCVIGEAAILIQHLPVVDANYVIAWKSLSDRYEKPRYLVNLLMDTFTALPKAVGQNSSSLRALTCGASDVIRALDASGQTGRDCWLIYLLINKVDEATRREWIDKSQDIENPTIEELLKFLDSRCDRLELSQVIDHVASKPRDEKGKGKHAPCLPLQSLTVKQRYTFAKEKHTCFNCLRTGHGVSACGSKSSCKYCKRRHHSMLHSEGHSTPQNSSEQHQGNSGQVSEESPAASAIAMMNVTRPSKPNGQRRSTLPTALVHVRNSQGALLTCRILLDSASDLSFISERCVQTLGLARSPFRVATSGISDVKAGITRGFCSLQMMSRVSSHCIDIKAHILGKITSPLARENIDASSLSVFKGYQMADPDFRTNASIDILLGNDCIWLVLTGEKLCDGQEHPIAVNTIFGWVITSVYTSRLQTSSTSLLTTVNIDGLLQRFWELEEVPSHTTVNKEDEKVETHFRRTHNRNSNGRYIVDLPFKEQNPQFADTFQGARSRFLAVERRLMKDSSLKLKYTQFMREYIQLGHMKEVAADEDTNVCMKSFYLPHHPVIGAKLRVVFDGSFQDRDGRSLNDVLHIGPCIQRNLFNVCLRFRMHRFVFSADIVKMFRQILVAPELQNFQRILWREDPEEPLKHYKLTTVTYGTACAPFLAVRVLEQLATDHEYEFPSAARILLDDFYVDDVLTGAMNEQELLDIKEELILLMSRAQLELSKWVSNSKRIASNEGNEIDFSKMAAKVLGLHWRPGEDVLTYNVSLSEHMTCTKRQVLSDTARIFDPLGILAPVVINFKILLQELWLLNLHWDSELPTKQAHLWQTFRKDIFTLRNLKIPRFVDNQPDDIELHGFSDASLKAYSAVIYNRVTHLDGSIGVALIAAKTRVSPLKQKSLPRLELCGALLLARLFQAVRSGLRQKDVTNRTAEILETIPRSAWRHVSTKENPADCASRGMLASDLINFDLWWKGPSWLHDCTLYSEKMNRPPTCCSILKPTAELEFKTKILTTISKDIEDSPFEVLLGRTSSWIRLVRVVAYVFRFVHRIKSSKSKYSGPLKFDEVTRARKFCLRQAQNQFNDDRQLLLRKQSVERRSILSKLSPFVDEDGIVRVGGRLERSQLPADAKHPVVLPKQHRLVELLLKHEHKVNLHPGVSAMFVTIRQKYWIIGARNLIRRITHECLNCFRQRHHTANQFMANLPAVRVRQAFPFEHTGCDYAGPILLKVHKGRNPRKEKGYICLFVCMVTSALHLELATDLSTDTFLAALKRFMARRGKCSQMYSDNGRNFVGAKRALDEMVQLLASREHNDVVSKALSDQGIKWNFIPPYSPHWGGKWESAVRSVKLHLRRVIGTNVLTFEQMHTLLSQIESVVNSRPLCTASDTEIAYLSPAHFLIGRTYTAVPEDGYLQIPTNRLSYWQHVQAMLQGFWKRWHQEYLTSLQQRPKWTTKLPNIAIGKLVLIKDSNAPPSAWLLGRVTHVFAGDDGLVRAVQVLTKSGEVTRPITKIAALPGSETEFQGGRDVEEPIVI
ncbi:uncharacterized protein [Drosophila tropicalis]|uniref:uncharacterized protein n=1 Tax=Drosophila tropicalis TaxID=46794 RepID=UPI0035AC244A